MYRDPIPIRGAPRLRLSSLLAALAFLYIAIVHYLLPYNSVPYANEAIFLLIPVYYFFAGHRDFEKLVWEFFPLVVLAILLWLYSEFSGRPVSTGRGYLATIVLAYVLTKHPVRLPALFLTSICCVMFLANFYHMANSGYDGRSLLSAESPNLVGIYMILFFYLCDKSRFLPGIVMGVIAVALILSRNYFLSLVVFYLAKTYQDRLWLTLKRFRIEGVGTLMLLSICTVSIISLVFVVYVAVNEVYVTGAGRLLQYADGSNQNRFFSNVFFVSELFGNADVLLYGLGDSLDAYFTENSAWTPHNSFLQIIAWYGALFGIVYFFAIAKMSSRYYSRGNLPYIFSYLFYLSFGQSGLIGFPVILFLLILAMPNRRPSASLFGVARSRGRPGSWGRTNVASVAERDRAIGNDPMSEREAWGELT